ncbi:hypothetical protein [Candidatus Binatus sp.]|uniref:hypothetical protein n=1 Tax=Candidatus Binatus sp. TaxID=2811406 RepID=UPI002F94A13B
MTGQTNPEEFSRISKLFVDKDQEDPDRSLVRRRRQRVTLACGSGIEHSFTLQLALLTAANIANRCFPGGVRIDIDERGIGSRLLICPTADETLGRALASLLGHRALRIRTPSRVGDHTILFGDAPAVDQSLRVTFDGWIAKTGPAATVSRLPEREFCTLVGVLAGALAVSEIFLSFGQVSVEAGHRPVSLSLWRPDLETDNPAALGVPVEFLPTQLWALGLGHLGQAYLWALGTLPYLERESTQIILNDFDKVAAANVETGLLLGNEHVGSYKTRVCSKWLEQRGFKTRLVERRFGPDFRCELREPRLALCGFDSNIARQSLESAQFHRVVECGLGGTASNFDTISLHTLPNPRTASDLWPADDDLENRAQQIARENRAYGQLIKGKDAECGRVQLAGKAVAVPFVGAVAASFVVAEVLRLLHGGPNFTSLKLRLASPGSGSISETKNYQAGDIGAIPYGRVRIL